MNKILSIGAVCMMFMLLSVPHAFAATTATLGTTATTFTKGQKFEVRISVNPNGTSNYVEQVVVAFSPDLFEVTSFSFDSAWAPLTQTGYDKTDNTNGTLTKTGGYPSGIKSNTYFGTVTMYAKKAGTGTIRIGSGSTAFEENSQSTITGNTLSITVSEPVAAPVPQPLPTPTPTPQAAPTPAPEPTPQGIAPSVQPTPMLTSEETQVREEPTRFTGEGEETESSNEGVSLALEANESDERTDRNYLMFVYVLVAFAFGFSLGFTINQIMLIRRQSRSGQSEGL